MSPPCLESQGCQVLIPLFYNVYPLLVFCLVLLHPFLLLAHSPDLLFPKPPFSERYVTTAIRHIAGGPDARPICRKGEGEGRRRPCVGVSVSVSVCASMFPVPLYDSFAQCASGAVSMQLLCGSILCAVYTFSFILSLSLYLLDLKRSINQSINLSLSCCIGLGRATIGYIGSV